MKNTTIYLLLLLSSLNMQAQVEKNSALYRTLKTNDSLLFNLGFNTCDISQFEQLLSDNFEFYHDKAGITHTKADFIQSIKEGICKLPYKPKRVLDEKTMVVYPLGKNGVLYGAMQMGTHRFYAQEKDKPEYLTSVAKFTHVWLLQDGSWKLSRGLSYNHLDSDTQDTDTINTKLLFKDQKETEKWLAQHRIPNLGIGFIKEGKIVETTVYGELEKGHPAPDNTIYNVASLTKPVTALIALKLVQAGKLDLDEPICTYWTDPDIADDPRVKKLTLRHLLSHQSGFPNWRDKHIDGKLTFDFDPGTRYQYSGEGYEYMRKVLENKTNKSLDQLAYELIFKPLQMNDTRFFWDSTMTDARFARWHDGQGNLYKTYKNTTPNGADDLLTTIEDYCKFMVHIMDGAGLSEELYNQMTSNQVRIKDRKYFGLGWWVDEGVAAGENALVHGGDDKGVHTIAFILPKSRQGLLIFTNCDNGTDIYIQTVLAYLETIGQTIIDVETK